MNDLWRDNEELHHKIAELENLMSTMKLQMRTQDQLLVSKEDASISLKQANINLEK